MKRLQLLFLLMAGLLISGKSYSQLSGTYTIGGISPNYATLDAAITDLCTNGVSGPVVFNIRPGTYIDSANCYNYLGTSPSSPITFQSENLDSTSVTIITPNNLYNLFNEDSRDYFNINEVTFLDKDTTGGYGIFMENLNISNCIIHGAQIGGIEISYGSGSIKNSIITCLTAVNYIMLAPAVITGNTFTGGLQVAYDSGVIFRHNNVFDRSVYSVQFLYGYWDSIEYNQFNAESQFLYWTDPQVIRFNKFSFPQDSGMAFNVFVDSSPVITNNTILGSIAIDAANSLTFTDNRISKGTCYIQGENSFISNNYIVQPFYAIGDTDVIYNNNFSSPGFLSLQGNVCSIRNNNFPAGVTTYYSNDTIIHNNYYPTASLYDLAQTNYNPQYYDSINIHTENPHLIAKGVYLSQVKYDINNILRGNRPTIGADELCIPSNDTISLACGDSVNLYMCNAPNTGNFIWTPAAGLNNPNIAAPSASPSVSTMYHVLETISGFRDSVYISNTAYKVKAFEDTMIAKGDSTMLLATYNAGATYQWLPATGLTNPNSYRTQAKPVTATTYTVTATVPGCGTTTDTVRVTIGCHNYFNESICIVTIDTATNKSEIIWGRTNSPPDSGSYNIYKDTVSGFKLTHSQPLNALSQYIDTYSDPSSGPQSYKLSTVDSCGESSLSATHTTIYLTTSSGINVFILNWTAYLGFTPSVYRIFRGPTMGSLVQIDSVPSTVLTYRDTLPPLGSIYAVEAVSPYYVCVATPKVLHHNFSIGAPLSGSFSNGFNTWVLGIQSVGAVVSNLNVYPNPGKGIFNLSYSMNETSSVRVSIMDELGQIVYDNTEGKSAGIFNEQLNLEHLASGIYTLRIQTNGGIAVRKLVILK